MGHPTHETPPLPPCPVTEDRDNFESPKSCLGKEKEPLSILGFGLMVRITEESYTVEGMTTPLIPGNFKKPVFLPRRALLLNQFWSR